MMKKIEPSRILKDNKHFFLLLYSSPTKDKRKEKYLKEDT